MTPDEVPISELEKVGNRCLQVVRAHRDDEEATLSLITAFAWALGLEPNLALIEPMDAPSKE